MDTVNILKEELTTQKEQQKLQQEQYEQEKYQLSLKMDAMTANLIKQNSDFINNEKERLQDEFEIAKENLQNEINNVDKKNYLDVNVLKDNNISGTVDNVAVVVGSNAATYDDSRSSVIVDDAATTVDYNNPLTETNSVIVDDAATTVDYNNLLTETTSVIVNDAAATTIDYNDDNATTVNYNDEEASTIVNSDKAISEYLKANDLAESIITDINTSENADIIEDLSDKKLELLEEIRDFQNNRKLDQKPPSLAIHISPPKIKTPKKKLFIKNPYNEVKSINKILKKNYFKEKNKLLRKDIINLEYLKPPKENELVGIKQNEKDLEEIRDDIRNFATKNLDQVIPNRIRSSDFPEILELRTEQPEITTIIERTNKKRKFKDINLPQISRETIKRKKPKTPTERHQKYLM